MNTKHILSVIGAVLTAILFSSCGAPMEIRLPIVQGGSRPMMPPPQMRQPQRPMQMMPPQGGYGYPRPMPQGNGYNGGYNPGEAAYNRVVPPRSYGDAATSRVGGFPPPGGYNPNYNYGTGGYSQRY